MQKCNCPFYWPFCDWICHATFVIHHDRCHTHKKTLGRKRVDDYFAFEYKRRLTFFCCCIWIHHPWLRLALLLHLTDINNEHHSQKMGVKTRKLTPRGRNSIGVYRKKGLTSSSHIMRIVWCSLFLYSFPLLSCPYLRDFDDALPFFPQCIISLTMENTQF